MSNRFSLVFDFHGDQLSFNSNKLITLAEWALEHMKVDLHTDMVVHDNETGRTLDLCDLLQRHKKSKNHDWMKDGF